MVTQMLENSNPIVFKVSSSRALNLDDSVVDVMDKEEIFGKSDKF
jgi:hypothetical protein